MYHQYAPFLSELREKLQTGSSLLYSFDIGLGINFVALYAYYLASPLNWFIIFVSKDHVIEFIMVMVILKIGLCGVSMSRYLRAHSKRADTGIALFSVFYALSGYMCAYYWNIMWLDCIVLFPLVMLGIEKLLLTGKGLTYTLSLGIGILSNYYISIMSCLFLCIYFVALCVLYKPDSFKAFLIRALRFCWYSLLAGGLAAVLLLPEIAAMAYTASADINFPKTYNEYFSIVEMLARHLPGVETEQALAHWPNIYCGTAVFLFFPLFLMNKGIKAKEKAVYTVLLIFFLMGFSINVLNFIWHGLHYPNSLPARQSYIYIFLLIFVCYRAYQKKIYLKKRELIRAFAVGAVFILLCQQLVGSGDGDISFISYYAALLLLSIYTMLLYFYRSGKLTRRTAGFIALCVAALELSANTAVTGITTTSRESYVANNEDIRALIESLFPSSDFFRVERVSSKTKNDGAWLNFPSASLFSSVANADCTAFFKKLGCEGSTNAYSLNGSTPLVDMLFSVRYEIYESARSEGEGLTFIESRGDAYLYEKNHVLPIGYILQGNMDESWMFELDDPILIQNSLCDLLGVSAVLVPNGELGNTDGENYAVTITEDGEYYALIKNPDIRDVTVTWSERRRTFSNVDRGYLIELGELTEGELIRLSSETNGEEMEAQLYRVDYDALSEMCEKLSRGGLDVSYWEDGYVVGTVNVDLSMLREGETEGTLFLSIPYDSGWSVKIDGEEVETAKVYDTFLSVSVPLGEHMIELSYMPDGLITGAAVSVLAISFLALTILYEKRRSEVKRILAGISAMATGSKDETPTAKETDGEENTDEGSLKKMELSVIKEAAEGPWEEYEGT